MKMNYLKKILLALLVLFVIAQFFGPEKNKGKMTSVLAFEAETKPNKEVKAMLEVACYDCHSSYTRYPWYSHITPINYWMADHVEEGKSELNFSKWSSYSIKKKDHKLEELIEMIKEKEMPLQSYTWTHGDARLTNEQVKSMAAWAQQVRVGYSLAPKPQ